MLSQETLAAITATMMSIPEDEVLTPRQPIDIDVQECVETKGVAMMDREQLEAAGLDFAGVEQMDNLAEAYSHYGLRWERACGRSPEELADAREKLVEAQGWTRTLNHWFTYAYRNDKAATAEVREIRSLICWSIPSRYRDTS